MIVDGKKLLFFLEDLANQARSNVLEYEEFHGNNLANIKIMNPMDSFLYGVASGKLQQIQYLQDLIEARMEEFGEK